MFKNFDPSFQMMFDSAADAMLLTKDLFSIVLTNPAAQALFGYAENEFNKLIIEDLVVPKYKKNFITFMIY